MDEDIVWTSRLDDRYIVTVRRTAPYRGELTITDAGQVIHREAVGLMFDAIFGPDIDDVSNFQRIAIQVIDNRGSDDSMICS